MRSLLFNIFTSTLFGAGAAGVCLYFFPDFSSQAQFTSEWTLVFGLWLAAKTLFVLAGFGMLRAALLHKKLSIAVSLPFKLRLSFLTLLSYTIFMAPLFIVSLKLWIWLPVFSWLLVDLVRLPVLVLIRNGVKKEPITFDLPAEHRAEYWDMITNARVALRFWLPASILGSLACWLATRL